MTTVSSQQRLSTILRFTVVASCFVLFYLPIGSMVLTALKTNQELFQIPARILPAVAQWRNFVDAWVKLPYNRFFGNSIILSVFYSLSAQLS